MTTPIAHAFNPGDSVYVLDLAPCSGNCPPNSGSCGPNYSPTYGCPPWNPSLVGQAPYWGVHAIRKGTVVKMDASQNVTAPSPTVVYTVTFAGAAGSKMFTESVKIGATTVITMFTMAVAGTFEITSITTPSLGSPGVPSTFTIVGANLPAIFTPGRKFSVEYTTNMVDNGQYTVTSATFSGGTAFVEVAETVPADDNTGVATVGLDAALVQYGKLVA